MTEVVLLNDSSYIIECCVVVIVAVGMIAFVCDA